MAKEQPKNVIKSIDAPKSFNASEDVSSLGTNARGIPVSSKPKKD